jgi:hypothetical protein
MVFAAAGVLSLLSGCQGKTTSQSANLSKPREEKASTPPTSATEEDLPNSGLNVYVNGTRINYILDSIVSARSALGKDQQDKLFGYGEGGEIDNELGGTGIRFIYDSKTGQFRDIVIKSDKYPIEGGGKIGDTRDEIIAKYPKGFYAFANGAPVKDYYFYLRKWPGQEGGVGFRFVFDKDDRVGTIGLGGWSFVP